MASGIAKTAQIKVKKALLDRGMLESDLAKEIGCTAGHARRVVCGIRRSKRVRKEIERILGFPIWNFPAERQKTP